MLWFSRAHSQKKGVKKGATTRDCPYIPSVGATLVVAPVHHEPKTENLNVWSIYNNDIAFPDFLEVQI